MGTDKSKINSDFTKRPSVSKQETLESYNVNEGQPSNPQNFYHQPYYLHAPQFQQSMDTPIYTAQSPILPPPPPHPSYGQYSTTNTVPDIRSQVPPFPSMGQATARMPGHSALKSGSTSFNSNAPFESNSPGANKTTSISSNDTLSGKDQIVLEGPKPKKKKTAPPTKRRALTACTTCRVKKVRCDNARPRCGSCVKNKVEICEYSNEDQLKDFGFEASNDIMHKLEEILDNITELKESKQEQSPVMISKTPISSNTKISGNWDMSFTSILKWNYFNEKLPDFMYNFDAIQRKLLDLYVERDFSTVEISVENGINDLAAIEKVMVGSLPQCVNSFFINCHTKVPILDVLDFLESIELYKIFLRTIPNFTLAKLASEYHRMKATGKEMNEIYLSALSVSSIENKHARYNALISFCKKIPLVPMVCALGAMASPLQFDNFAKYRTSIDERQDFRGSCLTQESIDNIPTGVKADRLSVASSFVRYSHIIINFFPSIYKEYSGNSIFYHVFESQFHLYIMKPTDAYRHITLACHNMMYYLERRRDSQRNIIFKNENQKGIFERLFWICLKLECELRAELSPKISKSGITEVNPPCNFPVIPDPLLHEVNQTYHSLECLQIATRFDDQYTWYYYLTEIAIRKVDNDMFDEYYTVDAAQKKLWDQPLFYNESVWISFIRHLNQYNGIVNSLSPKIRSFVLKEVDISQVFKSVAHSYERMKKQTVETTGPVKSENLDDFLIDDNLIIQAQSESIMYIKTRILSSKILLFRPIIYLILEDKIPIEELIQAALSIFTEESTSMTDVGSQSSSSSNDLTTSALESHVGLNYDKILEAPLYYQRDNRDEDFSQFFVDNESGDKGFKMNMLAEARKKILKVFFLNVRSVPKLNIPKLGGHRHPGQWYYLRNLLVGNFYMFLLYKKLNDIVMKVQTDEKFRNIFLQSNPILQSIGNLSDIINTLLPSEIMISTLEHSLLVYNYWKDESRDCEVSIDLVNRCLEALKL